MLERFMRANVSRWQGVYDRFPSPARSLLASARGLFLSQMRYAPETFSILKILRAHERWSVAEIAAHQMNALRETIGNARRNVPHYANYARGEIRGFADLRRLPVLERETVRQNHEQFLSSGTPPRQRIRAGTTGTTGGNLRVAFTEELARANWACLLRQWAGVAAQQPRVTLFGARVVPAECSSPPYWVHNLPERQILMSIFHLAEKTAPQYLAFLHKQEEDFGGVSVGAGNFGRFCGEPARIVSDADDFHERRAFVSGGAGENRSGIPMQGVRQLRHDGILRADPRMRARANASGAGIRISGNSG